MKVKNLHCFDLKIQLIISVSTISCNSNRHFYVLVIKNDQKIKTNETKKVFVIKSKCPPQTSNILKNIIQQYYEIDSASTVG